MAIKIHTPWNKNRIIGQKKPLQISHIWYLDSLRA